MKIQSLVSQGWNLQPIEVEVLLTRGLPELKFVGLPDQTIKESALRIKTAIKQSGYRWPEADQIIVNLKPNHLKKSSRGLELAVAAGILWETEQVPIPSEFQNWILYGELNLDGSIFQPEDLQWYTENEGVELLTGVNSVSAIQPWLSKALGRIPHLCQLSDPQWEFWAHQPQLHSPKLPDIFITPAQSELIKITALGRHSLLLAGPAGSGKSLMGEVIHSMGSHPDLKIQKELWRRKQLEPTHNINGMNEKFSDYSENLSLQFWRPFIRPHHSITPQGMVGGGNPIRPGELVRAHHGTLILDELLEFKPTTIESLREPLETKKLRIARASGYEIYDCAIHLIATTNLCPCGDFVPKTPIRCRFSLTKCRSYSQKLSGPLVDRFQILNFSHRWKGERSISLCDVKQELDDIRKNLPDRNYENSQLPQSFFEIHRWPLLERKLIEQLQGSHRRLLSTLRVSQTIADLNGKPLPGVDEIERALTYTVTPFVELQRWD